MNHLIVLSFLLLFSSLYNAQMTARNCERSFIPCIYDFVRTICSAHKSGFLRYRICLLYTSSRRPLILGPPAYPADNLCKYVPSSISWIFTPLHSSHSHRPAVLHPVLHRLLPLSFPPSAPLRPHQPAVPYHSLVRPHHLPALHCPLCTVLYLSLIHI